MTSKFQDEKILPFEINYLPQFSVKKCEKELNENPERKAKAVQELRSLLQKDRSTSGIDFHEDLLVAYLRRSKYRTADVQRQIRSSIRLRAAEERVFDGVPEECLDLPSGKCVVLLPARCHEGCALLLFRWGRWEPGELPYDQFRQLMVMLLSQALRDAMSQVHGFKVIHDLEGVSLKHARYVTPRILHQFYDTTVNCFPARWKEIHMVHQSPILKVIWNTARPFLTEKIRSRVRFHSRSEELLDHFPRSVLPAEYGGCLRETDSSDWTRRANREQQRSTLRGQPNYY